MNDLILLNQQIRQEADEILDAQGLRKILNDYGIVHVTGSYSLGLMTWRDLDIYLESDDLSETRFFELGKQINFLLKPKKMSFRNERIAKTKGLPEGLYWGIYLGNERAGAWKIDIWAVEKNECERLLKYCTDLCAKLTPAISFEILDIKSQCWKDPEYRRSYSSSDIYNAVLEKNIKGIDDFKEYLKTLK